MFRLYPFRKRKFDEREWRLLSQIHNSNGEISFPSPADPSYKPLRLEHQNIELLGDDEIIEYLHCIEVAVNNNSSSEVQISTGTLDLEDFLDLPPSLLLTPLIFF